jgi:hypothetical protein
MYTTCLFCTTDLGKNEVIEHFPVGRRLAFDATTGRLWVVCGKCARWNLTPIEERWEAIEECERRYRGTFVRVSTGNIGLAKLAEGLELVRIGSPLRPEFAAWRYSANFAVRRTRTHLVAGSTLAAAAVSAIVFGPALLPALTMGAFSIIAVPGVTSAMAVVPMIGALAARDYVQHDRVVARFLRDTKMVTVRAKHLGAVELKTDATGQPTLDVPHDSGWTHFEGSPAIHATGVLLAGANRYGAPERFVQDALREIEDCGDSGGFLRAAATRCGWRGGRLTSILRDYRQLGVMRMTPTERLALEMSVHEEGERRAMRGELHQLELAWQDAEQIAHISDGELTPPS